MKRLILIFAFGFFLNLNAQEPCKLDIPQTVTMNCKTGQDYQWMCSSTCEMNSFDAHIFDRWGKQLFSTKDLNEAWQAKEEPAGTYFYKIELVWADGREEKLNGFITLVK
ncbi:MAG: gliding motility-associated C-terminal domain-containing protein [Crocinitomicaceae bacterium]